MDSLFSDKLACPSGAIWPLFPASSHFFLSSALFALHPVVLAVSDELSVRFCMTFAHKSTISSSTSSLRIAWVITLTSTLPRQPFQQSVTNVTILLIPTIHLLEKHGPVMLSKTRCAVLIIPMHIGFATIHPVKHGATRWTAGIATGS